MKPTGEHIVTISAEAQNGDTFCSQAELTIIHIHVPIRKRCSRATYVLKIEYAMLGCLWWGGPINNWYGLKIDLKNWVRHLSFKRLVVSKEYYLSELETQLQLLLVAYFDRFNW